MKIWLGGAKSLVLACKRLALAIALAVTAHPSPALAQAVPIVTPPPPNLQRMSRGESPAPMQPNLSPLSKLEAQAGLDRYADCLVAKRGMRGKLDAYVRAIPGSPAVAALGKAAWDPRCAVRAVSGDTGVQLEIRHDTMRQALFGSMYRRDFGTASPPIAADAPPLSLANEFDGAPGDLSPEFRGYRALGDCVVRAEPAGARAWIIAPFNTPAAKLAQTTVVQALGGCLTAEQTVAIAPYTLRGIVAEALYRLTAAGAAGKKAG